jgi:hypothetical protein
MVRCFTDGVDWDTAHRSARCVGFCRSRHIRTALRPAERASWALGLFDSYLSTDQERTMPKPATTTNSPDSSGPSPGPKPRALTR